MNTTITLEVDTVIFRKYGMECEGNVEWKPEKVWRTTKTMAMVFGERLRRTVRIDEATGIGYPELVHPRMWCPEFRIETKATNTP